MQSFIHIFCGDAFFGLLGFGQNVGHIVEFSPVPEPSTLVLAGLAGFGLLMLRWRKF
jgi:hypothetical protein